MTTAEAGRSLVRATLGATALFTVAAVSAAVVPSTLGTPVAVLDLVLFVVGLAAFAAALVRAAARSRHEELSVSGLFLLTGSAPVAVRRALLGALAVQTVVAVATAAARPFTPLAFGVLVPTLGLGACGLWAARHGTFPPSRRDGQRPASGVAPASPAASRDPGPGSRGRLGRTPPRGS
jgi:hypothetical protein